MKLNESILANLREADEEEFDSSGLENGYRKIIETAKILWSKLNVLDKIDCSVLKDYIKLDKNTKRVIKQKVRFKCPNISLGTPVSDFILLNYLEGGRNPEWSIGYRLDDNGNIDGDSVALMSVSHGSMGYLASKKSLSVRDENFNLDVERGKYDNLIESDIENVKTKLEQAIDFIKTILDTKDEYEDEYTYTSREDSVPNFRKEYLNKEFNRIDDKVYFYDYLDDYVKGKTYFIDKMSDEEVLEMYETLKKVIEKNHLRVEHNYRSEGNEEEFENLKHYLPIVEDILKDRNLK